jgi:hypothetical protein
LRARASNSVVDCYCFASRSTSGCCRATDEEEDQRALEFFALSFKKFKFIKSEWCYAIKIEPVSVLGTLDSLFSLFFCSHGTVAFSLQFCIFTLLWRN